MFRYICTEDMIKCLMLFCISSPLIWASSLGARIWKPLNRPLQLPLKPKVFDVRYLVHFSWKSYKQFLRQTDCAHEPCIYTFNANCAAKFQCLKNHWKYQIIPNWKKNRTLQGKNQLKVFKLWMPYKSSTLSLLSQKEEQHTEYKF